MFIKPTLSYPGYSQCPSFQNHSSLDNASTFPVHEICAVELIKFNHKQTVKDDRLTNVTVKIGHINHT